MIKHNKFTNYSLCDIVITLGRLTVIHPIIKILLFFKINKERTKVKNYDTFM